MWQVLRHGGRYGDSWRVIYEGPEEKARVKYGKAYRAMRQGGVELRDPQGLRVESGWAPRLRTRW